MEKAYYKIFLTDVNNEKKGAWVNLDKNLNLSVELKRLNIETVYVPDFKTNLLIEAKGFLSDGEILNICKLVDFINDHNISTEAVNAPLEIFEMSIDEIIDFLKMNYTHKNGFFCNKSFD